MQALYFTAKYPKQNHLFTILKGTKRNITSIHSNWVGEATTWTDTWATGVSKEWGKNCGDMPPISCVDSGMYSSSGALPADACSVAEYVKGTEPLGGSFRVTLDTTGHDIINMRGSYTSDPIRHNAQAGVLESGGDGTSVEEILEKMPNVGDVLVTRSPVNEGANNGGHTWTVTFLRDAGASGDAPSCVESSAGSCLIHTGSYGCIPKCCRPYYLNTLGFLGPRP